MSGHPMNTDAPPVNVLRCSICEGWFPAKREDPEPICFVCEESDAVLASDHAQEAQTEISQRPAIVRRETVPVEYARSVVRPFGLGLGELPASRLTQSLRNREIRNAEPDGRESLMGSYVAGGCLLAIVGLAFLAVAAVG